MQAGQQGGLVCQSRLGWNGGLCGLGGQGRQGRLDRLLAGVRWQGGLGCQSRSLSMLYG